MDKYEEMAKLFCIPCRGYSGQCHCKQLAAMGRDCAAKAYEDVSKLAFADPKNRVVGGLLDKIAELKANKLRTPREEIGR